MASELGRSGKCCSCSLPDPADASHSHVLFRKCDVSNWDDVLELFQAGHMEFGGIDAVLANAGVNEVGNLLEESFDVETGKLLAPTLKTLDINLVGMLYTARCAVHYFGKLRGRHCQLVVTGSAAW